MTAVTSSPFDALAADYDRKWTNAPCGLAQRKAVWLRVSPYFSDLNAVLDIGCGTGADALWMQSLGITVHAIDSSSAMVEQARVRGVHAEQRAIEDLDSLHVQFDGALSSFGALNCVDSLEKAALSFRRLVRAGGFVAVCLLGRTCLWEMAYYLAKRDVAKALRRCRGKAVSSLGLTIQYPSHKEVLSAFGEGFRLCEFTGVGVCVPPSYVSLPEVFVRLAEQVDGCISHLPVFRSVGDHRLYIFERV